MSSAGERSIAQILTDIGVNAQEIVRAEIRLAKLEARAEIRTAGQGAILLAAGGTVSLLALALLSIAGVYPLATVVALWIAALIMAAVAAVIDWRRYYRHHPGQWLGAALAGGSYSVSSRATACRHIARRRRQDRTMVRDVCATAP